MKNKILKVFNIIYCSIFMLLTISLIFFNNGTSKNSISNGKLFIWIIFMLIIYILSFYIIKKKYSFINKNKKIIGIIYFLIIFIIQIILIYNISTSIGWDVGRVVGAAVNDPSIDKNGYFSICYNNSFLYYLFKIVVKIFGTKHIWIILDIINAIAIDCGIYFVYLALKKISTNFISIIGIIFFTITFGFFGYIILPYSDTLAIPFTIGLFVLYLYRDDFKKINKPMMLIIYSIISFFGYLLKPTTIIISIAIIIIEFFSNKVNYKKLIVTILSYLLIFILLNSLWTCFMNKQNDFKVDETKKLPFTHFIMMGLPEVGNYNWYDVEYTLSYKTKKEKISANIKLIKERLNDYGISGFANHIINKSRWITSEGYFYYGLEGNFANFDLSKKSNILSNIYYTNGEHYDWYLLFTQSTWVILMIGLCANILGTIKNKLDTNFTIVNMTIFGIFLFLLIFEGRSRYFILYLPFFCISSINGMKYIYNVINNKFAKKL